MSDPVDRQAAINAIENTDCELSADAWDELTDAIMRLPSAQQWIPVTERLPEYDEKVIVTKKVEGRPDTVDISYCYVQKEGFWSDTGFAAKVVAWMPLPEPFKRDLSEI